MEDEKDTTAMPAGDDATDDTTTDAPEATEGEHEEVAAEGDDATDEGEEKPEGEEEAA